MDEKILELRNDYKTLEKWLECKIAQEHRCDENILCVSIAVLCVSHIETQSDYSWILAKFCIAGTKEVRDGEAQGIGELISYNWFAINFCPFCGLKLLC